MPPNLAHLPAQHTRSAQVPLGAFLLAILIHTLWGGQAVAVKYSLLAFPPLWSAFWRFVIGIIFLGVMCCFRKVSLLPPAPSQWILLWAQSWLFLLQIGTMNWGIQLSTASLASVVIGAHPLFAALGAHFLLARDRMTMRRWLGLLLAFSAMSFAMWQHQNQNVSLDQSWFYLGDMFLLANSIMLGIRIITGARISEKMHPECMVFWQMLLALPWFFVGAWVSEDVMWSAIGYRPIMGLLYQGVIVAGAGFTISAHLVKRYSPSIMTSFGFIAPLSGVVLSSLLLSEAISSSLLIGMVGVGLGLVLIARSAKRN